MAPERSLTITAGSTHKLFLLLTCLWAGVLFYLSNQPGALVQTLFPMQDKLMHFVAYAILGFLGMGSVRAMAHGYRPVQAWLVCLLVTGRYRPGWSACWSACTG